MLANVPPVEQILASAVNFLIQGHDDDAANCFLLSSVSVVRIGYNGVPSNTLKFHFIGPRSVYDLLTNDEQPVPYAVIRALEAVLPHPLEFGGFTVRAQLTEADDTWRTEYLEALHGKGVHNQGIEIPEGKIVTWRNLKFRSESEARIAAALETTGVLFLPNCRARLSTEEGRRTREPDFLVCQDGKWGILEVDGPFHEGKAAHDHDRDRLFRDYRIRVVERFDWEDCYNDAPGVVQRFLTLLEKNG